MLPQTFNLNELGFGQKIAYIVGGAALSEVHYYEILFWIWKILSAPLERAKIILQSKPVMYTKSLFEHLELRITLNEIRKSEGILRFWYGMSPGFDKAIFSNLGKIYTYYFVLSILFLDDCPRLWRISSWTKSIYLVTLKCSLLLL
jgi:Mitochondrial carrier protein.